MAQRKQTQTHIKSISKALVATLHETMTTFIRLGSLAGGTSLPAGQLMLEHVGLQHVASEGSIISNPRLELCDIIYAICKHVFAHMKFQIVSICK